MHTSGGSDGMLRDLMCVDVICPPLGNSTLMGFNVGLELIPFFTPSEWPVAPVSAIKIFFVVV